ncbi:tannase/feruloyl esterase family alpha/beta hydrolase [Geodermatophilus sp. TF02-6]|uniref:tannase/feruloyl esterase family alpha/beta hydrolase n=1 Tax=Geodermatophilus sp. TF02-6 TaxID=2250575 RepID=UPI000DEB0F65|nr:tannase/feruloyl esterase family alpha/beta hydrolase [Geodermatophilus sp. TF02-6]RBY78358.1 tannase/feruloyl esterase family alpha/beta hydrolase [Geodermatophilus sp. TF02-6]
MRSRRRSRRPGRAVLVVLATTAASLALVVPSADAGPPQHGPDAGPAQSVRSCASLGELRLPDTTVTSAVTDAGDATTPASCRVTLTVDDPEDTGVVTVWVDLPESTWNGRFQGVGGGGFSGGTPERLLPALRAGYAAAATDAGNPRGSNTDPTDDAQFALDPDGTLDWPAIEDFGHEGVHDMTVTAKAVVAAYYGHDPAHSYFNGCSTGGRQGLMEAQRYPDDYDGIAAGAPVINWPQLQTMQIWGQLVMEEEGNPIPACEFAAALSATVAACDTVGDGVVDGVISDPLACSFDLGTLVGTVTPCGEITAQDVEVMRRIAQGPRRPDGGFLWYGLPPGAPYAGLHDVVQQPDGTLLQQPFVFDIWWFRYFLTQDPDFDWTSLTYESYADWFDVAVERYDEVLGASDPDLSAFHASGGKLVVWHGGADFGVPVQGSIDYYERVQDTLGRGQTEQFLRLFLFPGVGHCGGGAGAQPVDPLRAVVEWVEEGTAPRTLDATSVVEDGTVTGTRPVCAYPWVARWTGRGERADGSTYRCVPATRLQLRQA